MYILQNDICSFIFIIKVKYYKIINDELVYMFWNLLNWHYYKNIYISQCTFPPLSDLSTNTKDHHKSRRSANTSHPVMLDPSLLTPVTSLANVPGCGVKNLFALDDPAGRVLHKNRKSTEDREQKERREELMSVLDRVNDVSIYIVYLY